MLARIRQTWAKLVGLGRRQQQDDDLNRELAAHAAFLEDEARRRGLTDDQARRAAKIALGGLEQTKELHRDARSIAWLSDAWRDAGYALRLMRRNAAVTVTAALSLAIAIGANTAAFTVANALLFRSPDGVVVPDSLVDIGVTRGDGGFNPSPYSRYLEVRQHATTLTGVYARPLFPAAMSFSPGPDAPPTQVHGLSVTANYFEVLGVGAVAGRVFTTLEDGQANGQPVTVISSALWRNRFAGDPAIVGKVVLLNGRPYTIVGVTPEGFQGTGIVSTDLWRLLNPGGPVIMGARLKAGVSVAQAAAEVAAIGRTPDRQQPTEGEIPPLRLIGATRAAGDRNIVAAFMVAVMVMALLILLVACTNVSGVLLARAAARRREMAVRISIGAGRARLVRQLLMETILLFAMGGALGIALARVMTSLFARSLPSLPFPVSVALPVDLRVLAFTSGLSLIAALAFGLAPALQASKFDSSNALKDEAQGPSRRSRLRNLFIVAQVACSITLVVTGGLFVRALQLAGSAAQGFDSRGVELATIDLQMGGDYTDETAAPFWRELLERANQLPGVERAVLARLTPGGFESFRFGLGVAGTAPSPSGEDFTADGNIVSPGYFATMRIPIVAGRDFSNVDVRSSEPVVIISEAVAKHYWPGQPAIGQYMSQMYGKETKRFRVVGVVRDIMSSSLIDGLSQSFVYLPVAQTPYAPMLSSTMTLMVRTKGEQRAGDKVRAIVASLDPRLPITTTQTIEDSVAMGQMAQRVVASIAGSLGSVGLLLAAIGVYGLTAFVVTSRTRELGIRIALGARRAQIFQMVLRQGVVLVAIGALVGLAVAAPIAQLLASFLFGLPPLDPVTFGGAALLFLVTTVIAGYGPARRATRVDPLIALRHE